MCNLGNIDVMLLVDFRADLVMVYRQKPSAFHVLIRNENAPTVVRHL